MEDVRSSAGAISAAASEFAVGRKEGEEMFSRKGAKIAKEKLVKTYLS